MKLVASGCITMGLPVSFNITAAEGGLSGVALGGNSRCLCQCRVLRPFSGTAAQHVSTESASAVAPANRRKLDSDFSRKLGSTQRNLAIIPGS